MKTQLLEDSVRFAVDSNAGRNSLEALRRSDLLLQKQPCLICYSKNNPASLSEIHSLVEGKNLLILGMRTDHPLQFKVYALYL